MDRLNFENNDRSTAVPHSSKKKWIFSVNSSPPPPSQKRTRLWLAKIHSRVSWNITPLIISHIHYGVGGVKSVGGGGGINRKNPKKFPINQNGIFESKCTSLIVTMLHFIIKV